MRNRYLRIEPMLLKYKVCIHIVCLDPSISFPGTPYFAESDYISQIDLLKNPSANNSVKVFVRLIYIKDNSTVFYSQ